MNISQNAKPKVWQPEKLTIYPKQNETDPLYIQQTKANRLLRKMTLYEIDECTTQKKD